MLKSKFQSTLPREERHNMIMYSQAKRQISIHAPTRGATYYNYAQNSCLAFQSTLPREERRLLQLSVLQHLNFNPRSHERSDLYPFPIIRHMFISIHAPTRGATLVITSTSALLSISIHAPTRGATLVQLVQH